MSLLGYSAETLEQIAERYDPSKDSLVTVRPFKHGREYTGNEPFVPIDVSDAIVRRMIRTRFLRLGTPEPAAAPTPPPIVIAPLTFECGSCPRAFNSALKLASHRRVHKG